MGICQSFAAKYWTGQDADIAQAVCQCESGGKPTAHCYYCAKDKYGNPIPEDSRGPWQINVGPGAHTQWADLNLYDPDTNAQLAHSLWQSDGWNAWSTFTNGCYRQYLTGSAPSGGSPNSGNGSNAAPSTNGASLSRRGLIFLGAVAVAAMAVL